MGTTPTLGLPYPDPDDFVIEGDDAIRDLAEGVEAALTTAWQTYTPSSLGGWTVGNGVSTWRYRTDGFTCDVQGFLKYGSTSSVSGSIRPRLPFYVLPWSGNDELQLIGRAWAYDSSSAARSESPVFIATTATQDAITIRPSSGAADWGLSSSPWAWATGDWLTVQIRFPVDS